LGPSDQEIQAEYEQRLKEAPSGPIEKTASKIDVDQGEITEPVPAIDPILAEVNARKKVLYFSTFSHKFSRRTIKNMASLLHFYT
jgi:hypothetical protein